MGSLLSMFGNDESTASEMNYGRDSFNRFDDGLCEVLLSYLPLSDCFRLQCVNKQFACKIFTKQIKILLTESNSSHDKNSVINELSEENGGLDYDLLKYVLNKCVNINRITIDGKSMVCDETINTISNSRHHITHLTLNNALINSISHKSWQQMAETCLKNLESLSLNFIEFGPEIITLLSFTPELKSIEYFNGNSLFDECFRLNKHQLLDNIETVKYYNICDQSFITFADYFKDRLKSFHAVIHFISRDQNIDVWKQLAEFVELRYLCCDLTVIKDQIFTEVLKQIGLKCTKLNALEVVGFESPFYEVFNDGFKSLEKLIIARRRKLIEKVSLLKNCVHLKHLKFSTMKINAMQFKGIHLLLPQLTSVDFCGHNFITKQQTIHLMKYLAKLPKLRDLKICYKNTNNSLSYLNVIIFLVKCSSIRSFAIYPQLSTFVTINIEAYIKKYNRKVNIYTLYK